MSKKMNYLWLLLVLVTFFIGFSTKAHAEIASDATSKVGIRFVDRSPEESTSSEHMESKPIGRPKEDLPKTNEQPAVYLTIIGLIVVGCVAFFIGYKKVLYRKKNN